MTGQAITPQHESALEAGALQPGTAFPIRMIIPQSGTVAVGLGDGGAQPGPRQDTGPAPLVWFQQLTRPPYALEL